LCQVLRHIGQAKSGQRGIEHLGSAVEDELTFNAHPQFAAASFELPGVQSAFYNNITVSGGPAPVRAYIEKLLPDIMEGKIEPGRVFDRVFRLEQVPDGYRAMNERETIKL
jgi:hypothetical protein